MSDQNVIEVPDGPTAPVVDSAPLASAELSVAERDLARLLGSLLAEMWDEKQGAENYSSVGAECVLTLGVRSSKP